MILHKISDGQPETSQSHSKSKIKNNIQRTQSSNNVMLNWKSKFFMYNLLEVYTLEMFKYETPKAYCFRYTLEFSY